jgi:hypothetical protein
MCSGFRLMLREFYFVVECLLVLKMDRIVY